MNKYITTPFNSPLETGIRALYLLVACHPVEHDLNRLVQYDYLVVHSADANGPPSLHPPLPFRSNELLIRRNIVEKGILLMASAGLVKRTLNKRGILYSAEERAGAFLNNLTSVYLQDIKNRSQWVVSTFDSLTENQLKEVTDKLFKAWTIEFQPVELPSQMELL